MRRPLFRVCTAALLSATIAAAAEAPQRGVLVEGLHCRTNPSETYTLYLPSAYTPEKRWPALLVLDPRGRSRTAAELFRPAAEELGWILLSSDNSLSDGPLQPNVDAVNALWPEVHERYAADPRRIYLAGFSGTAMFAWDVSRQVPEIAGVIAASGRFAGREKAPRVAVPSFGTTGTLDFNYTEMHLVHRLLDGWKVPNRLEVFAGRHSWMPPPLARESLAWMDLQAMREGRAARDPAEIETLWREDLAEARRLEEGGDLAAAQHRYAAIVATFAGLHDVAPARERAAALAAQREVRAAEKAEEKAIAFEELYLRRADGARAKFVLSDPPLSESQLAADLRLDFLRKEARGEGPVALAAGRTLEGIAAMLGFYLQRDLMEQKDYTRAATALGIALSIHPDNPLVLYNLACSEARLGRIDKAFEHLEHALARGGFDAAAIAGDPDLAALHDDPRFAALLASTGG